MPDFTIDGNPGAIRSRCATMRSKGSTFHEVADSLTKIDTSGWRGRAADHFHEKFQPEPEKWRQAGDGFTRAAGALESYADALQTAQERAKQAAANYAHGDQVTHEAKNEYDASVSNARSKVEAARAVGRIMQLIIEPFHDPGAALRQQAVHDYESARSDLNKAALACASEVRASHEGAPNTRSWWHEQLYSAEQMGKGLIEGLEQLSKLALAIETGGLSIIAPDLLDLITGKLTTEELQAKYKLKAEEAKTLAKAAWDHPLDFAKTMCKAAIDFDTWKDNPNEALGKMIPSIALTVATWGYGAAAKGAAEGADVATALSEKADSTAASAATDADSWTAAGLKDAGAPGTLDGLAADDASATHKIADSLSAAKDAANARAAEIKHIKEIIKEVKEREEQADRLLKAKDGLKEFGEDQAREHTISTLK